LPGRDSISGHIVQTGIRDASVTWRGDRIAGLGQLTSECWRRFVGQSDGRTGGSAPRTPQDRRWDVWEGCRASRSPDAPARRIVVPPRVCQSCRCGGWAADAVEGPGLHRQIRRCVSLCVDAFTVLSMRLQFCRCVCSSIAAFAVCGAGYRSVPTLASGSVYRSVPTPASARESTGVPRIPRRGMTEELSGRPAGAAQVCPGLPAHRCIAGMALHRRHGGASQA
jgi:hypothetical protein